MRTLGKLTRASIAIVATATLLVGAIGTAAGARNLPQKKRLSLSSISIASGIMNWFQPEWLAQSKGFYKQQGLAVNFINITSSNADLLASLIGGSSNFIVGNASSAALSIASGAPIRSVMSQDYYPAEEIAISQSYASAHNIPAADSTKKQTLAQLEALRGSHIQIGVTNTTSDSYTFLIADAITAGLTIGLNQPNDDINVVTEGSTPNLIAALNAGKIPAFSNAPPNSVQPNTETVQLDLLPPDGTALNIVTSTTTSMVSAHSDTIQALVSADLEGWNYEKTHQAAAAKSLTNLYTTYGITSPEEMTYMEGVNLSHRGPTIEMTKAGYNQVKTGIDISAPGTVLPAFSTWIINKFAQNAIKKYRLVK